MKLRSGQLAPDFAHSDLNGKNIRLSAYKGKRVLLSFFRDVTCPFCNLRVHYLSGKRDELSALGLEMIFIFESSAAQLGRSSHFQKLHPVPLLADPNHELYQLYDVQASVTKMMSTFIKSDTMQALREGKKFVTNEQRESQVKITQIPADFLIDESGMIAVAHYGADIKDHLSIPEIKRFASGEMAKLHSA